MAIVIVAAVVLFSSGLFEQFEEAFDTLRYADPEDVPPEVAKLQVMMIFGLYAAFFGAAILMLPVFCWYYAFVYNYILGKTTIAGLKFGGTVRTWPMFGYLIGNLLILLLTLGLGFPWVIHRVMNFIVANVVVDGDLDAELVRQSQMAPPSTGEGLFELLDTGII